jgi:hypothetical protein
MTFSNHHNLLWRAAITWLLFIPIAVLNGVVREAVYKSFTGELAAHQISTVIAALAFFILAYIRLRNHLQGVNGKSLLLIGSMWLIMTVLFEFALGRFVTGASWDKILYDYNILEGRIWVLLLITLLITPFIVKQESAPSISNYHYSK